MSDLGAVEGSSEQLFGKSITVRCSLFLCSYFRGPQHTACSTSASSNQWVFLEFHSTAQ